MDVVVSEFNRDLSLFFNNRIIDIILYGSTIRGGFNKETSDIDFIVFVDGPLTENDISFLIELHERYRLGDTLKKLLEGRYLSYQDNQFVNGYYVGTSRKGWKPLNDIGFDYTEQAMILDSFKTLNETTILEEVLISNYVEVRKEIKNQLKFFLETELLDKDKGFRDYALVTAIRSLYTYLNEGFISKVEAMNWIHLELNIQNKTERNIIEDIYERVMR